MGSSYPNEYYDLLSLVGPCQTGYYATSEDGHLMPNASMDPNSSSNYQSSATSPVSPSSCTSADLLPGGTALPEIDTDFYLYDYPANDISPTLPINAGHVPSADRPLSTSVPQIPHLYCPPSVSSPDPLDEVRADLHRLQSTVQSSVRNVSHSHKLVEMRSLVRDTFNCLETMIQDEVDCEINSPNSINSTNSNNDRYACQLCEPYKRKMYSSKGAFRRHVSTEHAPRSRFFCPVCGWHTCRRDKVWDHFRHRHPPPARLRKNNIKHTRFRPPRECPLCKKSVQSWEAYFNCVSEHCRIHGSSPGTSGVQSRRNSGDSGSGGDGFNGNFAPGNPFNGQGPQTHFPSGGGDNSNNGSNCFSGYGSSFYGNGYTRENSFAQQVEQRLPHSLNSVPDRDDASPDPVLFSHNAEKKGSEINRLGPNSVSSHHQLLEATLERNPQDIPPKDNLGHHSGGKSQNPRGSSQTTSCNDKSPHQATSFKELSLKKSQARPASEPQDLPPEKCKLCGHLMTTCVECKLQKGTVDRCHLCTGKASQQHGLPRVLEDYDQYYDFACNGMSDRNRSASKIAWALEQVSQAFKPKGDPCSTEISRTSRDYLFNESSQWVSAMTAIDRVYALQVSEQSIFKATGSSYSTKALSSALEPHTTRSRFTAMTLAIHSPQIYSKIGHSDSSKGIHIELSEVRYDTQNIIGDTSVAHEPDSRKVAAAKLTAEHAIPRLAKTPESLCIIQSKSVSFNHYRIRTLSFGPYGSVALPLHDLTVEPAALEISGGFTFYHASCVVKDRQSSQDSTPLTNGPSAAEDQLTRKRRSKLRRKLQVIIGILVLQASVAHTLPVSKQLEDRNPRNPTVASEDTDLIEASSDLDLFDLKFLPQWLRETISTFSAGLIENVESSMFTTPVYKVEEEIWPKIKTFAGSMASYLETPVSPTVLEQHIAEYRKLGGDRPASRDSPAIWHPAREWLEEDEEDDMDYEPETEISEHSEDRPHPDEDHFIDEDDEDGFYGVHLNYLDPELHLGNIHIEFSMDEGNLEQSGEAAGQAGGRHSRVSATRLLNLLASNGLRHILQYSRAGGQMDDDDEDEDEELAGFFGFRRRARRGGGDPAPQVPSEEGAKLMASGDFGSNSYYTDELKKRRKSLATRTMWRELGIDLSGPRQEVQAITQGLIPGSVADKIIHFDSRCYSGQFSDDGNFFFSCSQDFRVRMYDTSNPYEWKYYKTVTYPFGQWTITDATLSPDNRFLAYTSIRNLVCLAPTDPLDSSEPSVLDLSSSHGRQFGIWSVRFSGDGREIVAGTSDNSVIVYDLETRQSVLRLRNHEDDVNAVCFGDKSSPHILYSGSDDSTLRVWDRRSMGDGREAGVFIGHTEGLTYVDSKGDGRYVLSNGKDQNMKLWDLRKMMTTARFDTIDAQDYTSGFDYRFEPYPENYYEAHPHDCSVVTFRGHRVLKTLIRCHFSPPDSTNSRYVYTGSEDGKVYVYNLDATLAGTIDVGQATVDTRPQDPDVTNSAYDFSSRAGDLAWQTCVRDASWHPNAPVLAATSWNGWGLSTGTCTVHSWNGGAAEDEGTPPVSKNYDCRLKSVLEYDQFKETIHHLRSRPVYRRRLEDDEYAGEIW